ncbi:MAG TPA: response regulator [Terriglobia bacterium]
MKNSLSTITFFTALMQEVTHKPRVAILEDHDDTREMLRIGLEARFATVAYRSAAELLDALERENFSAIVADIMLPGLDGFGFIKMIRQNVRFADICVIAVTALAMASDREKGIAAGFTAYLVKPITPEEISTVLWNHIGPSQDKSPAA